MSINITPAPRNATLKPTITVIGVGGAGGNAVDNMISAQLEGVSFCVANTDAQALSKAQTPNIIQLGANITQGLGAGANPDIGSASAEEAAAEIMEQIDGSHMVFITAGMGGGTGTGAAPVVARMAKEQGILTVAVVTKPFHFEGSHRMKLADSGLEELQRYVDTMIVIPNQNLFRIANEKTTFADAFRMADEVLHSGVRGVTDLMVMPGLINLDFADIRTVMREMGKAMMGTGEAEGERRAVDAAEAAISNPLLDDVSMKGARGVLINITGGHDMTLFEVDEAANRIRDEVDSDANIIFGSTFHDNMEGKMRVSVVATGIEQSGSKHGRHNSSTHVETRPSHSFSVRNGVTTAKPRTEMAEKPTFATAKPQSNLNIRPADSSFDRPTRVSGAAPQPMMRSAAAPQLAETHYEAPQQQHYQQHNAEQDAEMEQEHDYYEQQEVAQSQPQELFHFNQQEKPAPLAQEPRGARNMGRHAPTRAEIASHSNHSTENAMSSMNDISPAMHATNAVAHDEQWEENYDDSEEQPGLFRRVASRLSTREEERPRSRRIEVAANNVPQESEMKDDLEIPAFLRRQAN